MKYAVLTTRHTSGFLLRDSATTEFDVASSGNTTDVCKEFANECRKQELVPSFYYCLWGGKNWMPNPNARAIILGQLYELAKQFGEILYFWIDMKNWSPADLSTQEIYDALKNLQPHCVVEFNQHVQEWYNSCISIGGVDRLLSVLQHEMHRYRANAYEG